MFFRNRATAKYPPLTATTTGTAVAPEEVTTGAWGVTARSVTPLDDASRLSSRRRPAWSAARGIAFASRTTSVTGTPTGALCCGRFAAACASTSWSSAATRSESSRAASERFGDTNSSHATAA